MVSDKILRRNIFLSEAHDEQTQRQNELVRHNKRSKVSKNNKHFQMKLEKHISAKEKRFIMRENVTELLSKSTLMPFRWLKSSYRCFYCYEVFKEPKDLKLHQQTHIEFDEIKKTMDKYLEPVVYVDVSNLSCRLCPNNIENLDNLVDHLVSDHQAHVNKDVGACVKPFRLNEFTVECVVCEKQYTTFAFLMIHTNKYHAGFSPVLCEVCGQHFRTERLLRDHVNQDHEKKPVTCNICGEIVSSVYRMRTHLQRAHNKRYKCFICPETFENHYKRSRHMIIDHKKKDEQKCPHCSLSFVYRNTMLRHVRESHLKEKNVVCSVCGWKGFGKGRLDFHMKKHSDERNYKCPSCDKAFKTRKTMKQHHLNIHEKVARMYGNSSANTSFIT